MNMTDVANIGNNEAQQAYIYLLCYRTQSTHTKWKKCKKERKNTIYTHI